MLEIASVEARWRVSPPVTWLSGLGQAVRNGRVPVGENARKTDDNETYPLGYREAWRYCMRRPILCISIGASFALLVAAGCESGGTDETDVADLAGCVDASSSVDARSPGLDEGIDHPLDQGNGIADGGADVSEDASRDMDAAVSPDAAMPTVDGGSPRDAFAADSAAPRLGAGAWIRRELASVPTMTGAFSRRTTVEAPRLVHDATGCCSKYAFQVRNQQAPDDMRVGFVDAGIQDLVSGDAFGAGIGTTRDDPGVILFLANVTIEPRWPDWVSYSTTNYDGMVLDGSAAIYAEDLTIRNYNADTAMDIKSDLAQLVRLRVDGPGHRALRFWRSGPHYLVDSDIHNADGRTLLWFNDCSSVTLRVYDTSFNGADAVPDEAIDCGSGSQPTIDYLATDPRTTGEMHPMFSYY